MSYLLPFLEIKVKATPNAVDYPINIKNTIGKLKDELVVDTDNLLKNEAFVEYVKASNYTFIPHFNYYNEDVAQYFDIYGGSYDIIADDIEYNIKLYVYKIKQVELLTEKIINKFYTIFQYDYFVKNNILNMNYHNYRLSKYFINNLNNKKLLQFLAASYCNTKLFPHQMSNLARMFEIHQNPTIISISDTMPIYLPNELIYDIGTNTFISQSEIPTFSITSGMILDEPGTGKTLQIILYLLEVILQFKFEALVLVPNMQIKKVWIDEFTKHINNINIPFNVITFDELSDF